MVPLIFLAVSSPVFASVYSYGAIPPHYALGLLFILSIVLYSEVRIRILGIITFFIAAVALVYRVVNESRWFNYGDNYFIVPVAMFLFIGYLVIGRGLAKGTDEETELPVLNNINLLSVLGLSSGIFCLLWRFLFNLINMDFTVYYTLTVIFSSMAVTASLTALRLILRRNLDFDSRKIPFFYIFNKTLFRPVFYGFIGSIASFFLPCDNDSGPILILLIPIIIMGVVVADYEKTRKRIEHLPRLFSRDYFLIFFLSLAAGSGILLIAALSHGRYASRSSMQCLLFLPAIAGFSYLLFTIVTGKSKNWLSSWAKMLPCLPPILLIILNFTGILPMNMEVGYTQCQSNLKNIGTALYIYSSNNMGKFPITLEEVTPKYLNKIPRCAWDSSGKSFASAYYKRVCRFSGEDYVYSTYDGRNRFLMYCSGNNHKDVGVGENYPQYNSDEGLIPK